MTPVRAVLAYAAAMRRGPETGQLMSEGAALAPPRDQTPEPPTRPVRVGFQPGGTATESPLLTPVKRMRSYELQRLSSYGKNRNYKGAAGVYSELRGMCRRSLQPEACGLGVTPSGPFLCALLTDDVRGRGPDARVGRQSRQPPYQPRQPGGWLPAQGGQ